MAADVSSLARMLAGYIDDNREVDSDRKRELVTRDFLGGCGGSSSAAAASAASGTKELDLGVAAPKGWEKRLDLTSGEVFFFQPHSRNSTISATAAPGIVSKAADATGHRQQDRNTPSLLPLFPSPPSLGLGTFASASGEYQSVCTLDKVKSALDRLASATPAHKAGQSSRPRSASSGSLSLSRPGSGSGSSSGSPASSSTTASSHRKQQRSREAAESGTTTEEDGGEGGEPAMVVTGCPSCLSYVLISCSRPRCPRCAATVPYPVTKKPRLDLNLNSASAPGAVDGTGTAADDRS